MKDSTSDEIMEMEKEIKKELMIARIKAGLVIWLIVALALAALFFMGYSYDAMAKKQTEYGHEFVRIKDTRCVYDDTSKVVYKQYRNGIVPLFDIDGTPLLYDEYIKGGH